MCMDEDKLKCNCFSHCNIPFIVSRMREKVSFELEKKIEKDLFHLVTSVGQRKKFPMMLSTLLIPAVCRTRVI